MRTATVVAAVGLVAVLLGCAAEQKRIGDAEDIGPEFSAARLGQPSRSMLTYLSPEERDALEKVGMEAPDPGLGDLEAAESLDDENVETSEKVARATISVLGVGLTLGAMAAPYLLF